MFILSINQLLLITQNIDGAFDETPSRETRYKLEFNGLHGNVLRIVKSFLADRKQRVILNGQCSKWDTISAGLPQGSVLGPLLFLIYINDITHNVKCGIKLFADDTSLFTTVQDENVAALDLNSDLEKINLWAWQWQMQFNADKTEEVICSCKRNTPIHPGLKLGEGIIASKLDHKHLDVILDSKLSLKSHIRDAILKASRGIGLLKYVQFTFPYSSYFDRSL